MNFEIYFNFVFIIVMIHVIFGNYLYFRKIIPAINTAPGFLPSTQFKHIQLYMDMLQKRGQSPWFIFYLKNLKIITFVIVLLMVPIFLNVFGLI